MAGGVPKEDRSQPMESIEEGVGCDPRRPMVRALTTNDGQLT